MKKLLVVDLCGTIVRVNTTHGFMHEAHLPLLHKAAAQLVLSRGVSFLTHRWWPQLQRKVLIACLRGLPRGVLRRQAEEYACRTLSSQGRADVLQHIRTAQEQGVRVVLASASLDFIVEAFANVLLTEPAVSTRLMYRADERCVGRIVVDSTGRKLALLNHYLETCDFEFDVITDNVEDVDLMKGAASTWFIDNAN